MGELQKIGRLAEIAATLGPAAVFNYACYQLYLKSGGAQKIAPSVISKDDLSTYLDGFIPLFELPGLETYRQTIGDSSEYLLSEANEIVKGQFRPFGGPAVPLRLVPPMPLLPWYQYNHQLDGEDIKFWWEPARLGWVFVLGRAFWLTGNPVYAQSCRDHLTTFLEANPPYLGPAWTSAQEAALRIPPLAFALQVFNQSSLFSPEIRGRIVEAIIHHAERIPPTLPYARAQRNNHLLSEAMGLIVTASVLPLYPKSPIWFKAGNRIFESALLDQIDPDTGEYIQHSVNYHRLMLQLALLWQRANKIGNWPAHKVCEERISLAIQWLHSCYDPFSGKATNLGHNDGTNFLRLDACSWDDYRPVLQSTSVGFDQSRRFSAGAWDEPALWLGIPQPDTLATSAIYPACRIECGSTWMSIRIAHYTSRPAHADQLHMELWHNGENIALDPGTYQYNLDPPWDNAYASALFHNTIIVDDKDPMQRAGRFLWLRWTQSTLLKVANGSSLEAQHTVPYHGYTHHRTAEFDDQYHIHVKDVIRLQSLTPRTVTLHWLLPDFAWSWQEPNLNLSSNFGNIRLSVEGDSETKETTVKYQIIRAGTTLLGCQADERFGWQSPTYGIKIPALSFRATITAIEKCSFTTQWSLPPQNDHVVT